MKKLAHIHTLRECISIIAVLLCLVVALKVNAQVKETGIPIQKDFLPADYKATGQNFSITTDQRGLMYFANFAGILEFDGSEWRTILTKERTKVNTLVTDASGRIFVGTRGEIGYLKPDTIGELKFVSLNGYLKKYHITFPDVISSYSTASGVYFITGSNILLWNGHLMKAWGIKKTVINAFYVNGLLYVQCHDGGLQVFDNGSLRTLCGGDLFSEQITVNFMLNAGQGKILIGSGNQGLFLLNNNNIAHFSSPIDDFLKQAIPSCATALKDGSFALGTVKGGVVIINPDGSVKRNYNKTTSGLYDDNIHFLFEDNNHGLWVATDKNITRIETPSYLMFFNNKKHVNGNVNAITRFQNKLYIATDQGLLYYNQQQMQFSPVPGLQMPCLALLMYNQQLLVSTFTGVYCYDGSKVKNIVQGYSLCLYASRYNPGTLYAGQLNGVAVIQSTGDNFSFKYRLPGIKQEIRGIADDRDGDIWLQNPSTGLIKYNLQTNKIDLYNQSNGLPYNSGNQINIVLNQIIVGTIKGAFQYDKSTNRFSHVKLFHADSVTNNNWISKIVESGNGNLWVTSGNGTDINVFKPTSSGDYVSDDVILGTIKDQQIFSIYPDDDDGVWFGSSDNLIFFDTSNAVELSKIKPALIRSVKINSDSLIFYGTYYNPNKLPGYIQNRSLRASLNPDQNDVSFTFTSPSATGGNNMLYKYFLEGVDNSTSPWVSAHQKEYSNLSPGDYTFHVQAKNIFGSVSQEARYQFHIDKPWYRSIFIYPMYLLVAGGLIYLVVRARSITLLKEKEKLEGLIKERTAEVVVQKEAIENQSLELAGKNDELEKINLIVKSINSEINFNNLMQAILEKVRVVRDAEKAAMLVYDKPTNTFRFKASFGYNVAILDKIQLSAEDTETRYLSSAEEIYEDIYFIKSVKSIKNDELFTSVNKAKSSLMMVIRLNQQIHAYMIMENWQKRNAFEDRDFSLLRNLKEHFVAAIIKTTLLEDIQTTLINLKNTQEQLIRHEKMASIGQLTKGIVDRILNPLNYINNFSLISKGLVAESIEVIEKSDMEENNRDDLLDILNTIKNNMQKVNDHGSSASRIVKGMEKIMHEKSTEFVETDINKLIDNNVKIAEQDGRKEFPGLKVNIIMQLDKSNEKIKLLPYEMNTALNNLINNAYYAVGEKCKQAPGTYGEILICTLFDNDNLIIRIKDNGKGITTIERKQLFAPFYTTKPTAKGIGLGLYMTQDVIKDHNGTITLDTEEGKYTEFIITIPKIK